jgi:hypothetical protein
MEEKYKKRTSEIYRLILNYCRGLKPEKNKTAYGI